MSDFTSEFWSIYVAALTVISIIACGVLLVLTGKTRAMSTQDNTTGHVWDEDLREMNNPLPRWWVGLFWLTIFFSAIYLAFYPGLGNFAGKLGWSQAGQHAAEMEAAKKTLEPLYARFMGMPPEDIARDTSAMGIGERLYMNNCAQCHGSDARGSKGFPNLTDADWLYGGSHEKIVETLGKGRQGVMPPMGAAVGTPDDVRNVSHYVLSLSGSPHDSLRASLGKARFGACAACHGIDGKGNQAVGAPNLTDKVWLHGWGEDAIVSIINNGKTNVMPAQADKLSEAQIRVLASYVWGLSNRAGN